MYQYHKADNVQARHYFETALRLDPTFSRAYAGLSFTHFQGVFQNWEARAAGTEQAYRAAVQGVMADERDPAVHWALGRALWLRGRHQESLAGLTRCIELSPNFALGHYNLAFFHVIAGSAEAAISCSDYSRALSPFDPMLCAMLATRAMALVRLARFDEAAGWAVQSVMRPNAFPHIQILAACCQALAGHLDDARNHAAAARLTAPDYSLADFFEAFPFDDDARSVFRRGAKRVGIR
jgi:tetratricopeptide (TPR) repeat protein